MLLISNVFVNFSVLVCCRLLARKYGLKGGIEQRTNLVPVSALKRKGAAVEREDIRLSAPVLEPKELEIKRKTYNRAHSSSAHKARVALAAIASPTTPWVFRAITCARAHCLQSSPQREAL